ncbi:hypothetical protein LguiA_009765 [Lonicera macranthoides]
MAHVSQLPCNGEGICMLCKTKPSDVDKLTCSTCVTPWHVTCLSVRPESLASALQWQCPDCTILPGAGAPVVPAGGSGELVAAVRVIEADSTLSERQKAERRQLLLSGNSKKETEEKQSNDILNILDENVKCSFCLHLPERPVTTPCGHNFCLKCFQKWISQGKRTCAKCRQSIPSKMASQPRINPTLVAAIRTARMSKMIATGGPPKAYHFVPDQDRPDKAFTTERAKRAGNANAASGKIFVTVPTDHFGPILADNDPERNQGVLVGECWKDRMECRQWGAHNPHVAGIGGQQKHGAQSVVISGGYEDDEDHGEWFLYTGSGGRDLGGNKRTNKIQSSDQTFKKLNEALRVSCKNGYPVRVIRSHKEKRSSYAPEDGCRYDGIYRIEKCWRKDGIQGFKVCRYLFVRCDNEPAPWTSDQHGDRPRPLPVIPELEQAIDIFQRTESPSWDFDEEEARWMWKKPPPASKKQVTKRNPKDETGIRKAIKFSCLLCKKVMVLPLTTPCAHNFCKRCLEGAFAGQTFTKERSRGGRTLRAQKNIMKCPSCTNDISEYLQHPEVNRELMVVIEKLQNGTEEEEEHIMEELDEEEDHSTEEEDVDTQSESEEPDPNNPVEHKPRMTNKRRKSSDEKEESISH